MFLLLYSNQYDNAKRYKVRIYYLSKIVIKNYNFIINGKNFYNQQVYQYIRKLTTVQGEDYTASCSFYDYIKNHYRLTTVDLSRQKELNADPKAIQ